jgi:hypothetical protein
MTRANVRFGSKADLADHDRSQAENGNEGKSEYRDQEQHELILRVVAGVADENTVRIGSISP